MKVTQKAVTSFNRGNKPGYEENANKAKGYHSQFEDILFREVQYHDSGVLLKPISVKKVNDFLEVYPNKFQEIRSFLARHIKL